MRLIDVDALLESLTVDPIGCAGCPEPEWIDELIDILDTAPTVEPQGDLISRADAIEAVRKCVVESELLADWNKAMESAQELLSALPSAEAVSRESIMAAKFHPYPFTHITPMDVDAEVYKRGWNDALDAVADNAPSADAPKGDLISRQNVLCILEKMMIDRPLDSDRWVIRNIDKAVKSLPSAEADMSEYADRLWKIAYERGKREASAEANPTVVRCKTMIPYGDFREWAKRIREDNPNVIVIPFDAEVASADAVQGEWKHTITGQPYCSNCEYVFGEDEEFSPFWKHCPMCGARMKGGDEE